MAHKHCAHKKASARGNHPLGSGLREGQSNHLRACILRADFPCKHLRPIMHACILRTDFPRKHQRRLLVSHYHHCASGPVALLGVNKHQPQRTLRQTTKSLIFNFLPAALSTPSGFQIIACGCVAPVPGSPRGQAQPLSWHSQSFTIDAS